LDGFLTCEFDDRSGEGGRGFLGHVVSDAVGRTRKAGSDTVPPSASTPQGTCESAMTAAGSAGRSAADDWWNFLPVEEQ